MLDRFDVVTPGTCPRAGIGGKAGARDASARSPTYQAIASPIVLQSILEDLKAAPQIATRWSRDYYLALVTQPEPEAQCLLTERANRSLHLF